MAVNYSPSNTDGTVIGRSTSEPVGLHGVTPNARAQLVTLAGNLTGTTDGTIVDVAAVAISAVDPANPTVTEINTGVNVAVTSLNLQLKEIQVKLNELITALQTKGVIRS